MKKGAHLLCLLPVVAGFIILGSMFCCSRKDRAGQPASHAGSYAEANYVGRLKCRECHEKQYELFLNSDHDMAMDTATKQSVLGNFNDATFRHFGVESRFYMDQGKFMVHTEGLNGEMTDFQILYVFGIRPLQQYLVAFPGGRLQCLPIAWDTRPAAAGGQKWFHLYQDEYIGPKDVLHWTHVSQNWNYMCAECHSTNLRKNYSYSEKSYHTSWSEIDVSCEACHGPGSRHIEWAREVESGSSPNHMADMGLVLRLKDTDGGTWVFDPGATTARRSVPRESDELVQMCSRCHARRSVTTEDYYHGGSLLDTHWPSLLEEGLYYPDGQIQEEVYVYASFLQSKMYQAGVVCKDCHEPHSGQTYSPGNALCYRCHLASTYGGPEHHFHDPAKEGASCTECHMHERSYMVVDPRRDHSIRIPRPDLSEKLATPNACNQCHSDKSVSWATEHLRQWYGEDLLNTPHYGEVFLAGRKRYPEAREGLIRLARDGDQPPMVRATAVSLLGAYPGSESTALLDSASRDPNPLIRYAALSVIRFGEATQIRDLALPRLNDSIKLIRLMAANALTTIPSHGLSDTAKARLKKALSEYNAALMINADHPSTHLNFGNLFLNTGDFEKAEASYLEAIELEPGLVAPYINLADLYRRQNRDAEGEELLLRALETYPDLAALHYALGLLKVRQKQEEEALHHLKEAARLDPDDPHYSYVLAIGLNSQGQVGEAISTLEKALELHPYDREILYSLATLSLENNMKDNAKRYADLLIGYYPEDQNYRQLSAMLNR